MRPSTLLPFVLCALASPSFGAIYTKSWQLPRVSYDYIIVGAGNAGNVLANALSEDSNTQVLVLEAGVSDENVLPAIAPFLGPTLTPGTPYDWNYTVAAQEGLDNRSFPYPRGRILGGSTTANYMVHEYGSSEDYDKLASITGDSNLNWSNMKQYIQVHEKLVPPTDGHNTTGQYRPELHSTSGQVLVSLPGNSQTIDAKVIATTQEFPEEYPFNQDVADGNVLGIGWVQASIGNGVRSSSSTSYLRNANSRPNLHVLINATVQKVLQTGFKSGKPLFGGVLFSSSRDQFPPCFVLATKEVILSAGSIGTPQILMLSGIGAKSELSALRIPTIINNPSVGKNLSDHVLLPTIYNVNGQESLDDILRGGAPLEAALNQWTANKTGVIANTVTNQVGFLRLPNNSSIFSTVPDPANGPKASHFELIFCNFWLNPGVAMPATGNFLTIIAALISPTSRGFVKLTSDDVFDKPIIDPKMATTAFDKFALREAVRSAKRFVTGSAWDDYVVGPYGTTAGVTDAELDTHVRQMSTTVFHPVGTSAMSAPGSGWGVVDPNFKVKGAAGLRVVDASVWPYLPNAHTQGPTYLMAHRAADVIKAGL